MARFLASLPAPWVFIHMELFNYIEINLLIHSLLQQGLISAFHTESVAEGQSSEQDKHAYYLMESELYHLQGTSSYFGT